MNSEMLEEILACPALPSLPAVALKVVELTGDPNVKIPELARTIQNDQGMASKVLRTVNSSFYGLRQRCGTIDKALVMLGLSPVKSIVLGFSLVSSIGQNTEDQFDYRDYWRRGLYTAVGAKCIVEAAGRKYGDEVFLAGLLQDIGVMACFRALGQDYLAVMEQTQGDHRKLCKCELSSLELQHPDIGAMLCERWKLPRSLVVPVKYHERPTAAPSEHLELTQAVALGNLIHDSIIETQSTEARRKLYERAQQWLGLGSEQVEAALARVIEAVKEMAGLFKIDVGGPPNPDELVASAERALVDLDTAEPSPAQQPGLELLLVDPTDVSPELGIMGKKGFDFALRRAHKLVRDERETAGLLNIVVEVQPGAENAAHTVVALLKKSFGPFGGAISRLSDWLFTVVTVGATPAALAAAAEDLRQGLARASTPGSSVGVSVGIACMSQTDLDRFPGPEHLLRAAAEAVQLCKASGGNTVRIAAVTRNAA